MKKIIVSLFALSLLFACNGGQKGSQESKSNNLSLKGSDTVLPLGQATAEQFMKTNPGVSISVVGGGSGTGVTALIDGNTDIAMCSRDLKGEEKLKLKEKGIDAVVKSVAVDALAVIVHKDNKVDQLTREQIEKIFTGEIKNWKEVGGEDAEIVVYSRENSSGTYEFFKEHVMDKKNYASTV